MGRLLFYSPATKWTEALPLGNGKTGAMVYGGFRRERIFLNDATLWSGYPRDYSNPESLKNLDKARELIFAGNYEEAEALVAEKMRGEYSQSYMPLGELTIKTSSGKKEYKRELYLDEGIFRAENGKDLSEAFASYPAGAIFYKMTFSSPRKVVITLKSKLKSVCTAEGGSLILSGVAPDNVLPNYVLTRRAVSYAEGKGIAFAALAAVDTDGIMSERKGTLGISGATYLIIKLVTDTGFLGYDRMPVSDPAACVEKLKERAQEIFNYEAEKERHIRDYKNLFSRHSLELFGEFKATDKLIKEAQKGRIDNYLVKLFYDYGKYLTIAGSRDSEPLNLQGLWNADLRPPWSSNLTTNINFEMNYWGASSCNLGECLKPFYKALSETAESGRKTARVNFGADGFCANHNVDIWRMTSPVKGSPMYMYSPLCGAWIANEAYAHSVTENGKADGKIVKLLEEAARFCLDYLTEHEGRLVTCPSSSPEAQYLTGNGRASLGYASAFDMGVIKQCFSNISESSKDKDLVSRVSAAKEKLFGFVKTSTGINEWHTDLPIADKGHRHFSPLYALYPAKVIKYYSGGESLKLAKELFDFRLLHANNTIGWSAAWAICLAARLHDGERAYKYVKSLLSKSVLNNLFGFHPPSYFQIDCNFGFLAAVNEMLFYEEDGIIDALPACPAEWDKGKITGHKIKGATVHMKWEGGKVTKFVSDKPVKVNQDKIAPGATLKNVILTKIPVSGGGNV